jgi:hypothetical protein
MKRLSAPDSAAWIGSSEVPFFASRAIKTWLLQSHFGDMPAVENFLF